MKNSHSDGAGLALFLAIVATSAITMIYMFWRFPLVTSITTVVVLTALFVSAVLARSIEVDTADGEHGEPPVGSH